GFGHCWPADWCADSFGSSLTTGPSQSGLIRYRISATLRFSKCRCWAFLVSPHLRLSAGRSISLCARCCSLNSTHDVKAKSFCTWHDPIFKGKKLVGTFSVLLHYHVSRDRT